MVSLSTLRDLLQTGTRKGKKLDDHPKLMLPPTNKWVGDKIGYSESGASLLRRGERRPTVNLMIKVASETGWGAGEQLDSASRGVWHVDFEKVMTDMYNKEIEESK